MSVWLTKSGKMTSFLKVSQLREHADDDDEFDSFLFELVGELCCGELLFMYYCFRQRDGVG